MHTVSIYSTIPFVLMLLSIAIFPLVAEKFWENNKNKLIVSVVLSVPVVIYLLFNNLSAELVHTIFFDYIPFIILLGSLFVITGGIHIGGNLLAKPIVNTIFLGIGAILASFMGTTGAAMLLIRPLINTNKERKFKKHLILFFIAIVANCGGLLTPLGDPPLFMMYLRGASFFWFFRLFPEWLFVNGLLLIVFYFMDSYYYKRETQISLQKDSEHEKKITITGKINFIFLLGVVLGIAFLNKSYLPFIEQNHWYAYIRELFLILMAALSLKFTGKTVRKQNHFSWHPIEEVAYLFLGIFFTMIPCLIYLNANAQYLSVNTPVLFYYLTGLLSSFLDNTPTAVTFYELAKGLPQTGNIVAGISESYMRAISLGAVLFGSMTYIGNGPNFLVKTIAEHYHIKMPDFFAYMYKFSVIILLPIFILLSILIF